MEADRAATFGSRDKLLSAKIERRQKRIRLEDLRHERNSTNESNAAVPRLSDSDSNSDGGLSDYESAAVTPSCKTLRSHHRSARIGTPAFIPHDIMQKPKG